MAQIITDENGLFHSTHENEYYEDLTEEVVFSDQEDQEEEVDVLYSESDFQDAIALYSSAPSTQAFTPQSWQINIAANRKFGEHYLIYGDRNTYTTYYLVLGKDISFNASSDTYSYRDCDFYSYNSYNNTVTYDHSSSSGSLTGSSHVVYSDLYFDYVGVKPSSSFDYLYFFLLFVIILLLLRRRH